MAARIFCRTGELAGVDFEIAEDAVIGRGSPSSIVLPTQVISQRHARICRDPGTEQYFLEDLGSRNGTRLDGIQVSRKTRLDTLHVITFAEHHDFIFQVVTQPQRPAVAVKATAPPVPDAVGTETRGGHGIPVSLPPALSEAAGPDETQFARAAPPRIPVGLEDPVPARRMTDETSIHARHPLGMPDFSDGPAENAAPVPGRLVLEIREEGGAHRQVELVDGAYDIGRSPDCHVCLPDRTLSRRHARIDVNGRVVTITDLGSENGTFVGGERIKAPINVVSGDEITLGNYVRLVLLRITL